MKGSDLPIIRCPCGAGACRDRLSKTKRNPDRRFFTSSCGFFVWCDQVMALLCRCGAGACSISMATSGPDVGRWFFSCRVKQGHGACGFFQWVDPELNIKLNMARKRCNACNQSMIIPPAYANYVSTRNDDLKICIPSSERQQSDNLDYNEAVCMPKHQLEPLAITDLTEKDEVLLVESQQGYALPEIESSEHNERISVMACENENPISLSTSSDETQPLMSDENESCLSSSSSGEEVGLSISCPMSHSDIHCDQPKAWCQISNCGVPLNATVYAFGLPITPLMSNGNKCSLTSSASGGHVGLSLSWLTLHSDVHRDQFQVVHPVVVCRVPLNCGLVYAFDIPVTGWLGRLAFPPSRILFDSPPSTPFCCVFPSFNAIYVPKQAKLLKVETTLPSAELGNAAQSNRHASQLYHDPTGHKTSSDALQEDISGGPILEGFINRLAVRLQTELVTLLKSMKPHDHGTMLHAANAAFVALAGLSVDFGLFSEDVLEYVHCASKVTQIEASLQNGGILQELIEQYISEKHKFDEISEINAEAVTAFTVFNKQLQSFRDHVRRIRNLLLQIETQMYYCENEALKLGKCVDEISRDVEEYKRRMQTALEELEEAFSVQQEKEREKHEANLALERAGVKLTMHM